MPAGRSPRSRSRHVGLVAGVVALSLSLSGCYQNPDPTEWGPVAKKNFVAGCTTETKASGGTTTTIAISTESTCVCIYNAMVKKYNLTWDKMKDYEKKQADAKPGAKPPTPPSELTKALDDCQVAGPVG